MRHKLHTLGLPYSVHTLSGEYARVGFSRLLWMYVVFQLHLSKCVQHNFSENIFFFCLIWDFLHNTLCTYVHMERNLAEATSEQIIHSLPRSCCKGKNKTKILFFWQRNYFLVAKQQRCCTLFVWTLKHSRYIRVLLLLLMAILTNRSRRV